MNTLTVTAEQLQRLGALVIERLCDRERLAKVLREKGQDLSPPIADDIEQLKGLLRILNDASNVGAFDPRIALKVLEHVAERDGIFVYMEGMDTQAEVEHAVRLCRCGAFEGRVHSRGVQATSRLTERGEALLAILKCWNLPIPGAGATHHG